MPESSALLRAATSVLGAVALASLAACGSGADHPSPTAPPACTDRSRAIAIARGNATSTPVTVVSAGCVRFGDAVHGATILSPDTPVWSVVLGGSFLPAGCPAPMLRPRTSAPCGPPATTERVIVDRAATHVVMVVTPGATG